MRTDEQSSNRLRHALLIGGIAGPPTIWLLQFQIRYSLVPWCCANGNRSYLWAASGGSVAIALGFLIVASVYWFGSRPRGTDAQSTPEERRTRFMATLGIMSSTLFLLAIAAQAVPVLMIDPCIQ